VNDVSAGKSASSKSTVDQSVWCNPEGEPSTDPNKHNAALPRSTCSSTRLPSRPDYRRPCAGGAINDSYHTITITLLGLRLARRGGTGDPDACPASKSQTTPSARINGMEKLPQQTLLKRPLVTSAGTSNHSKRTFRYFEQVECSICEVQPDAQNTHRPADDKRRPKPLTPSRDSSIPGSPDTTPSHASRFRQKHRIIPDPL
jgi:hypothetical protein